MNFFKKTLIYILTLESRLVLKKYKPVIIAVTGSVGKTSTKDAIFDVLKHPKECLDSNSGSDRSAVPYIRKSEKSFNSKIGLPLTILGVGNAWKDPLGWLSNAMRGLELIFLKNEYPDILILEIGADHPGDIRKLTHWFHPDIAVITKIGDVPVHVEFFKSPEEVRKEKLFLAKGVKEGGTIILYADDEKMRNLKFEGRKVMTYGITADAAVKGSQPAIIYKDENGYRKPSGISFKLEYAGNSVPVSLSGVLGIQHVYPILAAVAVGVVQGLPLVKIVQGLPLDFKPSCARMSIIDGANDSTIIDDSYNSSPTALAAALAVLGEIDGAKRKIAILGDMMELGRYSVDEHKKAGALAAKYLDTARGDLLITVGQRAKGIMEGAVNAGMSESSVISFDSSTEAAPKVKDMLRVGDAILVKGSQSPRMERITKAAMADPSRAPELLVRQEKEWLEKL
jgi:UDP-N-acetylmuramoyl-tripeptide--D-alanyl-D-alanine ligase